MKRILSLTLVMIVAFSLFMVPASAADYMKLTWVQGTGADAPKDVAMVNEAMNVITREKLGCEVEILYMKNDQVNLSIAAGEVYDMYFTCDWFNDFGTRVSEGMFADITDAIQKYTPNLYSILPENVWDLSKINGRLYAIPVKKDYAPMVFIVYDKGFYDSINMTWPDDMEDISALTPYLEAYKKAFPDQYPLLVAGGHYGFDAVFNYLNRDSTIGFNYKKVETDPENASKIISAFEDEVIMSRLRLLHQWYKAGYINPDAATTESIDAKINALKVSQAWRGYDYSPTYGYTCGMTLISGPYLSTSGVRGSMNAFSVALEDQPERLEMALKYQELVNTDLQFRDMLRYGIEGVHFNYKDGFVIRTQAGKDNYGPWAFSQGSYALSSIETTEKDMATADKDQWEKTFASYSTALVAVDAGFSFNTEPVKMEITSVQAVKEKYIKLLFSGTYDPDVEVPNLLKEMRAAGLDKIIAEAQAQLDAYLASKK